jgi:hypothetical protein
MQRSIRKLTREDKFARKYYCKHAFPASKEPCEYCKGFYEPYNFIWEYKTEKGDIRLHERVDTHYCPMCGRKLGEK